MAVKWETLSDEIIEPRTLHLLHLYLQQRMTQLVRLRHTALDLLSDFLLSETVPKEVPKTSGYAAGAAVTLEISELV